MPKLNLTRRPRQSKANSQSINSKSINTHHSTLGDDTSIQSLLHRDEEDMEEMMVPPSIVPPSIVPPSIVSASIAPPSIVPEIPETTTTKQMKNPKPKNPKSKVSKKSQEINNPDHNDQNMNRIMNDGMNEDMNEDMNGMNEGMNEDKRSSGSRSPESRQVVKLTDKIETPSARQKRLQMAESNSKEFNVANALNLSNMLSLSNAPNPLNNALNNALNHQLNNHHQNPVANHYQLNQSNNNHSSQSNNNHSSQSNNNHAGRTVGTTFSIVSSDQNSEGHTLTNKQMRQNTFIVCLKINKSLFNQIFKKPNGDLKKQNMMDPFNDDSVMSAELQMELSQDKTLDVPEIWGLSNLDIKPERVHFKQFSDIDEECLNQRLNTRTINDKKIHLVLASFKNKTWPTASPYACWNCTEHFENAPVGIPTIAMSDNYEDSYYLEGNFCSFNCAGRYLFDSHGAADSQLFTIYEILNFIYNELTVDTKAEYEKIKLAPERICLKKFGGHLSLEEYRKNFMTKINYEVFRSPLIPALYHIQENTDLTRLIRNTNQKKKTRL